MRACVGCKQPAPAGELIRVVVRDGWLVVDRDRRLGGRGANLHRGCAAAAEPRLAWALRATLADGAAARLRRELEGNGSTG